ncbi:MAG: dihydrodipicolinate synthase family protein [Ignavibacteriaceae bacterium]
MKKRKKYSGVITPMVTPVNEKGEIHNESVEKLLDFIIKAGNLPFILGTTGEIASNSFSNREHLVKLALKIIDGKVPLFSGVTDNSINTTINTAKKYADFGVNVFVLHLPYFYPLTDDLILRYYEMIADNSPVPIIIYNIKSITHMSIPVEIIEKLSSHPKIIGLKDSDRDIERVKKLADLLKDREDFSLFIGWTNKSSEALLLGFDGIVPNTANIIPSLYQSLYKAALDNHEKKAYEYQVKADKVANLVQSNKTMARTVPEIKAIMNYLNICTPYPLPPLVSLNESESKELIDKYKSLNL